MTKPTNETPPIDKVADVSDKLADKPVLPKRNRNTAIVTAAATGIGSAALLAALLYANRSRKPKKPESE
jgi:transcriptional regulatory protein LevR